MRTPRTTTAFVVAIVALLPASASAQVAQFAFTTAPQNVPPGAVSGTITLQAQDSGGGSALIPQTACLHLGSASAQGQFSSSATNWNPVSILTMNKSTANKNFYYKDSAEGTYALSVQIAFKPETETRSCASWPTAEWNIQWTVTQNITIGGSQSSSGSHTDAVTATTTNSNQTTTATNASNLGPVSSASSVPVEPQIFAYAGKDREVVAGADSVFEARAVDKKGEPIKPGRFLWTFGDGASAEGQTVMHHFAQPGRYAVILDIADGLFAASHQIIVTALPVPLGLSVAEGNIVLTNTSGKNLDISYWSLRSAGKFFMLPKNTVLLGGSSVPFTSEVTYLSAADDAALLYPNGVVAADATHSPQPSARQPVSTAIPGPVQREAVSAVSATPAFSVPADSTDTAAATTAAEVAAAANAVTADPYLWWLGAFALALAGGGAMVVARRAGKREWDIIEEK